MSTAPVWQSSDEQLLAELGELAPQVEAELAPRRSALSPLAAPRHAPRPMSKSIRAPRINALPTLSSS
jgi:hypothetical protein